MFVVAGFTQKEELYAVGATWPLFDGESLVQGRAGNTLVRVRQSFPSFKQALQAFGLPSTVEVATLEREAENVAQPAQSPTNLWAVRDGVHFSPKRVHVVISRGDLEFHLRSYAKEESLLSRVEKLNEASGHLETVETAEMSREALLESPLCSVLIAKKGTRFEHPIQHPGRIDQTPPSKIPYSRSGDGLGRAIRVRLIDP